MLAKAEMCRRSVSRPDSGLGWAVPHSGPPAEPKRIASLFAAASRTAGVMGLPCLSMEQPPQRSCVRSKGSEREVEMRSRTRSASTITSGPTWSPGRTRTRRRVEVPLVVTSVGGGLEVERTGAAMVNCRSGDGVCVCVCFVVLSYTTTRVGRQGFGSRNKVVA